VKPSSSPSNPWTLILAAAGGLGMIMIDATGTSVALPEIQRGLHLDQGAQQWIITIYALTLAAIIPTGGRLGDIYGRARIFTLGVILFGLGSLICGLAPTFSILLAGRVVEGVGNILMAPSAALLAAEAFGPASRGRAMGIYSGLGGLAMIAGPILAGALIQHFDWRAVFFINPPIAVLTLLLLWRARPRDAGDKTATLRPLHSVHLAVALALFVLGLQESHHWGWLSPATLSLIGGGLALLAVFVFTQTKASDPLVDVRLLTNRQFAGDSLILFCAQFSTVGQSAFSAIYLQRVLHFTPMQTGLSMLLFLMPLMIAAPISGRLYDRYGVKVPALIGLILATSGIFLQAVMIPKCSFPLMILPLLLIGAGLGFAMSQTYTDGTALVDRSQAGRAFGALDTLRQLGGAVGMAAIGTVVVAHERTRLLDLVARTVPPGTLGTKVQDLMVNAVYGQADAVQALHSQYPEAAASLKLLSARSIADGFYLGGSIMVIGLVGASLLLRGKPRPGAPASASSV
jgi:EmrB/QacA subfamily drug resistance transporter